MIGLRNVAICQTCHWLHLSFNFNLIRMLIRLRASPAEALFGKISKMWSPKWEKHAPAEDLFLSKIYLVLEIILFYYKIAIALADHN